MDDFISPENLAIFIIAVINSDDHYNPYFSWNSQGLFIDTKSISRLGAMLHEPTLPITSGNLNTKSWCDVNFFVENRTIGLLIIGIGLSCIQCLTVFQMFVLLSLFTIGCKTKKYLPIFLYCRPNRVRIILLLSFL